MVLILAVYFAISFGPYFFLSDPFGRYMLSRDVGGVKLLWERDLGALKSTFNSIEWILHHYASCSLWKFLSSPLYGFYSIKPPTGGSMYMV
jgi:hypothetical protein